MKKIFTLFVTVLGWCVFLTVPVRAGDSGKKTDRLWEPIADDVYLQEVSHKIPLTKPVTAIGLLHGRCYAVIEGKIHLLSGDEAVPVQSGPVGVKRLKTLDGFLWALSDEGIYRLGAGAWEKIDNREFVDLCLHLGVLHAASRDEVYRLEEGKFIDIKPEGGYLSSNTTMMMEDGTQVLADPVRIGPIDRIASYSGTLYMLAPGSLTLFNGRIVNRDFIDWGSLPSPDTRDLLSYGSRLFISTQRGLGVLRGAALTSLKGNDGLPFEETTCLEAGFDNDIWIGTSRGAIRMMEDDWHYFGADHWLPGDKVNDIAIGDRVVYIATDQGVGIIHYEPYTLRKKADHYEKHLEEWGHKRLGFVHTLYQRDGEWIREISDNDGGHTAPWLAAMSYKYAVTGDESARREAVESFKALLWLESITTVDGLIARSIWSTTADADTRGRHGSGGLPAKWFPTEDGQWYWKGDASSDEVTSHFYAVSLFHDLVAEGIEKEMAAKHLSLIAAYILENDWRLIDFDGKPTRWGRWDPKYLLRPYGSVDKGLNGLEAMMFMKAAHALTGDEKFEEGFGQLTGFGYLDHTVRVKNTFPPSTVAPWDDDLAFLSYYTILRYTRDPILRSVFLRSLERTFEVKRMEHIAWFNFAYGALTGNDCEAEQAVKHLREWTLDCVEHDYRNSFRDDLFPEPGYVPYEAGTRAMSPRETCVKRGSRNALGYDGGAGGRRVMEPTGFLRDYWMGRYHGIIEAPVTQEENLISIQASDEVKQGAAPYDGPGRPEMY